MSIARPFGLAAPVAVWLLALAVAPGNAHAQTAEKGPNKAERTAARDAYDKGTVSFEHGDYVAALDSFVKANALIPSVQALYWIAQAQDKLGRVDAAVEAYEAITARADFAKLSDDKAAVVRARLVALKPSPAPPVELTPPPAEAPTEPVVSEPPPVVAPAPVVNEPPAPPEDSDKGVLAGKNTAEMGVMGGVLFVADENNLQAGSKEHADFDPAFQVGVRAAFFPVKVFGVEAEYAHGFANCASCDDIEDGPKLDSAANFDVVRAHLIGQVPTSRLIPFALLGGGLLHAQSDLTGSDTDFLLQAGVGLKVMATRLLVPRLDARLNMTQKRGGGFTDGISFHPEILLGLSFRLGG